MLIDSTPYEDRALEAVLNPLGEAVAEIGKGKPLDHYSREEILRIVNICLCEYQKEMLRLLTQESCHEEVPL